MLFSLIRAVSADLEEGALLVAAILGADLDPLYVSPSRKMGWSDWAHLPVYKVQLEDHLGASWLQFEAEDGHGNRLQAWYRHSPFVIRLLSVKDWSSQGPDLDNLVGPGPGERYQLEALLRQLSPEPCTQLEMPIDLFDWCFEVHLAATLRGINRLHSRLYSFRRYLTSRYLSGENDWVGLADGSSNPGWYPPLLRLESGADPVDQFIQDYLGETAARGGYRVTRPHPSKFKLVLSSRLGPEPPLPPPDPLDLYLGGVRWGL